MPYLLKIYFTIIIPVTNSLTKVRFPQHSRVLIHNMKKMYFLIDSVLYELLRGYFYLLCAVCVVA